MHFSAQIYTKSPSCVSMQVTELCFRSLFPDLHSCDFFPTRILLLAALFCFNFTFTPPLSFYPTALPEITMTVVTSSPVGIDYGIAIARAATDYYRIWKDNRLQHRVDSLADSGNAVKQIRSEGKAGFYIVRG